MTTVTIGRGAITVTDPPPSLKDELSYWKRSLIYDTARHVRDVKRSYEHLYTQSKNMLVTMPGFGHRILAHLRKSGTPFTIVDRRIPMPKPDLELACTGARDNQIEPIIQALMSGGGIVSLPTGFGKSFISSALIKAFDPEQLKLRGTPVCVFAAPDKDITRKNWEDFTQYFPDREVGLVMSGVRKFSDDIQVITLDSLHLLEPSEVGVLIVDEVHTAASEERSENLSKFQNAIRFGVSATPTGRFDGGDLMTEGLFGPVVVKRTYQDGVKTGALVPIEVYWVKAPKPHIGMQYYSKYKQRDAKIRAAIVSNPDYCQLVAGIMRRIPDDMKTICFTQWVKQMANIHSLCPEMAYVHAQTKGDTGTVKAISPKRRKEIYGEFKDGYINKIFATYVYRQGVNFPDLDIVINASAGGSDITAKQIPGRASRKVDGKDKAYVIDFIHDWDYDEVGGKRKIGPLLSSDMSRRRSYKDLGFVQKTVESIDELPFLKEGV